MIDRDIQVEVLYPTIIITGDFNHYDLQKSYPKFHQFVNFPTRGKFWINVTVTLEVLITAVSKTHLGKSDHLAILLHPTYIRKLKADTVRTVKIWTDNALAEL